MHQRTESRVCKFSGPSSSFCKIVLMLNTHLSATKMAEPSAYNKSLLLLQLVHCITLLPLCVSFVFDACFIPYNSYQ